MSAAWWAELSDDELQARLTQHGLDGELAGAIVADRDDLPHTISELLGDDDAEG